MDLNTYENVLIEKTIIIYNTRLVKNHYHYRSKIRPSKLRNYKRRTSTAQYLLKKTKFRL